MQVFTFSFDSEKYFQGDKGNQMFGYLALMLSNAIWYLLINNS